jgi:hypothetical protein
MAGASRIRKILPWILLVAIILVNVTQISQDVLQFGKGILENIDQPGLWRGAKFARSRNFADFVIFLNQEIPEDAEVVLPPREAAMWTLANSPAMEFFLAPRSIRNCTDLACGAAFLDRENTYILIAGQEKFPGKGIEKHPERIRMFNDTWGVYGPEGGLGEGSGPGFNSKALTVVRGLVLPLLAYGLWFGAGGLLIQWLLPDLDPWLGTGLGFGAILGLQSLTLYLALLLGLKAIPVFFLAFWIVLLSLGLFGWLRGKLSPGRWLKALTSRKKGWPLRLALVGMGGLMTYLAVGSGHHATDAYVLWGAKGMGILDRGLEGVTAGTNTTRYPLHIPLLIAGLQALFGDVLPASKLIFPGYYVSLLMVMYGFLRQRTGDYWAGLTTVAAATMPILMRHGRIGYANLPLAFYLVGGVVLSTGALRESWPGSRNRSELLGGYLLALGIWTRPEGIFLGLVLLAAAGVWSAASGRAQCGHSAWRLVLLPGLLWVVWMLTSRIFYSQVPGSSGFLAHLQAELAQGRFHLADLGQILAFVFKQLVNPQTWGTAGIGVLVLWLLTGFEKITKDSAALFIAAAGAACVLTMIGMYFTFAFEPVHELEWWLTSGFNRMILPGMLLIWLSAAEMMGKTLEREEKRTGQ